jgi:hypothetical protein
MKIQLWTRSNGKFPMQWRVGRVRAEEAIEYGSHHLLWAGWLGRNYGDADSVRLRPGG